MFIHDWGSGAILRRQPKACAVYGFSPKEFGRFRPGAISAGRRPTRPRTPRTTSRAKRGEVVVSVAPPQPRRDAALGRGYCLKAVEIAGRPRVLCTREVTTHARPPSRRSAKTGAITAPSFNTTVDGLIWDTGRIVDANFVPHGSFVVAPMVAASSFELRVRFLRLASGPRQQALSPPETPRSAVATDRFVRPCPVEVRGVAMLISRPAHLLDHHATTPPARVSARCRTRPTRQAQR